MHSICFKVKVIIIFSTVNYVTIANGTIAAAASKVVHKEE